MKADAIFALGILDRLLAYHTSDWDGSFIPIPFSFSDETSREELALYRLMSLGLVVDYMISYNPPRFEVVLSFAALPENSEEIMLLERKMLASVDAHMSHWGDEGKKRIDLAGVQEKYEPSSDFTKRIKEKENKNKNKFKLLSQLDPSTIQFKFFYTIYEHLFILLHHTYEDVVKMRYDMLWNLYSVVNSEQDNQCQRIRILPHFEGVESVDDSYRCGCCNVCSPELDFLDRVRSRPQNPSEYASMIELEDLLRNNSKRQKNRIFFYSPAGVIMWPIQLLQEDGHVAATRTERKKRRAAQLGVPCARLEQERPEPGLILSAA